MSKCIEKDNIVCGEHMTAVNTIAKLSHDLKRSPIQSCDNDKIIIIQNAVPQILQ